MATYYRYKRPITNSGAITTETMTTDEWLALETNEAVLVIFDTDGNYHDFSEYVSEMQIVHNDVDGEKAGRDKKTGRMVRAFIVVKHTLQVKLINHLPQSIARKIFNLIETTSQKTSFEVIFQSPCIDHIRQIEVYCSTINYGAQRYERYTGKCYYDGMNFNLIQM